MPRADATPVPGATSPLDDSPVPGVAPAPTATPAPRETPGDTPRETTDRDRDRGASPARAASEHRRHSVAWLVWALAAAVSVQLAPNPLYAVLVIGIAALVVEVHAPPGPYARAFPVLVALGVTFALVRIVLAAPRPTPATATRAVHDAVAHLPGALGGFTAGGPSSSR